MLYFYPLSVKRFCVLGTSLVALPQSAAGASTVWSVFSTLTFILSSWKKTSPAKSHLSYNLSDNDCGWTWAGHMHLKTHFKTFHRLYLEESRFYWLTSHFSSIWCKLFTEFKQPALHVFKCMYQCKAQLVRTWPLSAIARRDSVPSVRPVRLPITCTPLSAGS